MPSEERIRFPRKRRSHLAPLFVLFCAYGCSKSSPSNDATVPVGDEGGVAASSAEAGVVDAEAGVVGPCHGQCASPTPRCEPQSGKCVECLPSDDQCLGGRWCSASFQCVSACTTAADCSQSSGGDPLQCCGGTCVDVKRSDTANCGACGVACGANQGCGNGSCACDNAALSICKGACVDTKRDVSHCGDCATACAPDVACNLGTCANYVSCKALQTANPLAPSDVYTIKPDGPAGTAPPFSVYCDMTTDGGGWTRGMVAVTGDTRFCDTVNRWATMTKVIASWPPGGEIMSKVFTSKSVSSDGGMPVSVVKFTPGPYGSIPTMFSFPRTGDGWTYDTSSLFNLTVITGLAYSNTVWWDWGGPTRKAFYCIGSAPDHQACLYDGTNHGQCGNIYYNGNWETSNHAQEIFVREP